MSDGQENVLVEIQIQTIAMDCWVSLDHKIYYKYQKGVPIHLKNELKETLEAAQALDRQMERLHNEVITLRETTNSIGDDIAEQTYPESLKSPDHLINSFIRKSSSFNN